MESRYGWKSARLTSGTGFTDDVATAPATEGNGANSGAGSDEEGDHQKSDFPAWGLLRMEARLWLLAFENDLDNDENFWVLLGPRRISDLPNWEG